MPCDIKLQMVVLGPHFCFLRSRYPYVIVGSGSLNLLFLHKDFQSPPRFLIVGSGVLDLGDEDVARAGYGQFVHDKGNLLPQHHDGDGDPAALFQRSDGRRAVTGGDLLGDVELAALDVVGAEDVFLRG